MNAIAAIETQIARTLEKEGATVEATLRSGDALTISGDAEQVERAHGVLCQLDGWTRDEVITDEECGTFAYYSRKAAA